DEIDFAIRFKPVYISRGQAEVKHVKYLDVNLYFIAGPIVFRSANLVIVDCGFLIRSYPPPPTKGDWVEAAVSLSVDAPGHCATTRTPITELSEESGMYRWFIRHLWLDATPWVETAPNTFNPRTGPVVLREIA